MSIIIKNKIKFWYSIKWKNKIKNINAIKRKENIAKIKRNWLIEAEIRW